MLVYDGILPKEVKRACIDVANKGYRYAIEVDHPPASGWQTGLAERKWYEHRNSSEAYEERPAYERTGQLYEGVRRDLNHYPTDSSGRYNGGMFIFLLDEQDYRAALKSLDHVVSAQPFKTILGAFDD